MAVRKTNLLSEGDTIEYGLTAEVKEQRKGNWWLKVGATTTIRSGETVAQAQARLSAVVEDFLDLKVKEVLG